jgi:predicted component of type VI protein secretion system
MELFDVILAAIDDAVDDMDDFSPANVAGAVLNAVLPTLAGLDIEVRQLTQDRDKARALAGVRGDLLDEANQKLERARRAERETWDDLETVLKDRTRARDIAVALEQQLAEIKRLAYIGGQPDSEVRRWIIGVFEDDRHAIEGGETPC